ncbi:lipopolysaccharide biosynthesis protein [Paenibacillus camelliae]|uniref:lipopolysaccharide biosynthesis protein n=1 Tax=Paenibacillus camelliae TaxID=512410 RepID=UPI00203D6D71|nr:oligosaccharide flippase family protein [Paenibacillus camelliae]MCM3633972.1 oligosaccharide flippase family protein [Paenibacillus camelliae]
MIKKILSTQYIRSILKLTTGSILAQAIIIIVSPLSTRLYTPEELGVYTLILTFSAMFGPVITGKYDVAIVSAKDSKETVDLIIGSIAITIAFTILITFGYSIYLREQPEIIKEVGGWAYILIPILILQGFVNTLTSYNNRKKQYSLISQLYVLRTVIQNIGLVIFGFLKLGAVGLLISQLISLIFGIRKQGTHLLKENIFTGNIELKRIKTTLIKYKNQFLYSMPANFLNSASYSLMNIFISGLYGLAVFGYYSIAYRILGLPLSLVSMNISKVFLQKASEEKNKYDNYTKSFNQMIILLTIMAIPMVLLFILFAPNVFRIIFGDGWEVSGEYVRILAPMFGIRFIVTALSPALVVSGKQKLELILQSLFVLFSLLSYFITKQLDFNFEFFLICISTTYSLVYLSFLVIIYRLSK